MYVNKTLHRIKNDPKAREASQAFRREFEFRRKLVLAREATGLTQEEIEKYVGQNCLFCCQTYCIMGLALKTQKQWVQGASLLNPDGLVPEA
ncbi:MAG: hypothetical protein FWG63_01810 [Defluviitaleaceae bacterium]|nr:hypothetical protein [Defluviitaleaceae bacterium]